MCLEFQYRVIKTFMLIDFVLKHHQLKSRVDFGSAPLQVSNQDTNDSSSEYHLSRVFKICFSDNTGIDES